MTSITLNGEKNGKSPMSDNTKDPGIVEVTRGDLFWLECGTCKDELTEIGPETGSRLECGFCGATWWEGEFEPESMIPEVE